MRLHQITGHFFAISAISVACARVASGQDGSTVQGFGTGPAAQASGESRPSPRSAAENDEGSGERRGRRGRFNQAGNGSGERPDRGGRGRGGGDRGGEDRDERDRDSTRAPATERAATSSSSASGVSGFGAGSSADERASKWADGLIEKYDKNGDAMLQASEQEGLGQSSRAADADGDGVITKNELVAFASGARTASSTSSTRSSRSTTGGSTATSSRSSTTSLRSDDTERTVTSTPDRKSYRFTSVKERGASSWRYASRDANGDGQVSMSEFSRSWSDRTAAEFTRYDKNGDGMISPDEAR